MHNSDFLYAEKLSFENSDIYNLIFWGNYMPKISCSDVFSCAIADIF